MTEITYTNTLSRRLTQKYVGTYRHLDEWQEIGSYTVLSTDTTPGKDLEESLTSVHMVLIDEEADKAGVVQIDRALHDEFTVSDCHHDYDCCGCRSFRTHEAKPITGRLWCVTVHSSRNY